MVWSAASQDVHQKSWVYSYPLLGNNPHLAGFHGLGQTDDRWLFCLGFNIKHLQQPFVVVTVVLDVDTVMHVVSEGETPPTEQAKSVAIQLLCQRVRRHMKNAVAISQISTASKVTSEEYKMLNLLKGVFCRDKRRIFPRQTRVCRDKRVFVATSECLSR